MFRILLNFAILLAEIGICIFAIIRRVHGDHRFIYEAIAALSILAFFFTVAYISLQECNINGLSIVCPAK